MAFASAVTGYVCLGNKRGTSGTYTNASGDTGGDVDTGLGVTETFRLQPQGTSVATNAGVVNETLPVTTAVTIVTDDNNDGYWEATGVG